MEWSRGPTIGRGSSANVSLASSTSGDLFAVKSSELSRSVFLQREQQILSQLSSPNVVKYLGFEITSEFNISAYNIFLEYISGGSIFDKIRKEGGSLDESTIRFYTREIVTGLDYLHSNGLVHCDIKGENLLIGKDCVKIADFGCAKRVHDTSEFFGTPAFMAPEVARGEKQGLEADVWALGCTVIEMATGSHPWPKVNDPVSALYWIGFSGNTPEFPAWFSEKAMDFLSKCLKRDCKERWTVKQLLQHPFLDDLELDFPKVNKLTRDSPISVLDQCFWESMEVSESHRNPTHASFSSDSQAERIMQFIGSNSPNWNSDEDWVTVRTIDSTEEHSATHSDSYMFSSVDLEDSIVTNGNLFPDISVDTICNIDRIDASTDCVMLFKSDENVNVSKILNLKRKLMESYVLVPLIVHHSQIILERLYLCLVCTKGRVYSNQNLCFASSNEELSSSLQRDATLNLNKKS